MLTYPNLALMKLSAFHTAQGDEVEFYNPFKTYDIVYKSKVFTYKPDAPYLVTAGQVIEGGTGYHSRRTLPDRIEHICPDYSLYGTQEAYGFLTRGCIRRCRPCLVPWKEEKIRPNADITEFIADKKAAILMDNNVLASDWGLSQIEKIIRMGIRVDFNQGLDARIIANNPDIAKLLARVKWLKPIRMSYDTKRQIASVEKATRLLRKYGATPSNYSVYLVLKDDIKDALARVMFLKRLKLDPFVQPYRALGQEDNPSIVAKDFARWVNLKFIFNSFSWKEYRGRKENGAFPHL